MSLSWIATLSGSSSKFACVVEEPPQDVLQRRADEEVLLLQPQLLSRRPSGRSGYRTFDRFSDSFLSSTALT